MTGTFGASTDGVPVGMADAVGATGTYGVPSG